MSVDEKQMEGGGGVRESDLKNVEQRFDSVGKWNDSLETETIRQIGVLQITCVNAGTARVISCAFPQR